jgi:hypothetical protein
MARKARDYAAEQRRRNELARERGFTSRGQQRRQIESGKAKPIAPKLVRSPKTIAAQKRRIAAATQGQEHKYKESDVLFNKSRPDEERAQDWSDLFARSDMAKYLPDDRPKGVSRKAYTDAYMAAFVEGPERYKLVRHSGGSDALRHWFVTINHWYQANEYETRYGDQN